MPPYSGTISGLAANEMQLSAQQRAAAERQLMMLVDQHRQDRAERQRSGELAEQSRQFDVNAGMARDNRSDLNTYRTADLALREKQMRAIERDRRMTSLLNRRRFDESHNDRALKLLLPEAEDQANHGMFDSEDQIKSMYPAEIIPYVRPLFRRSMESRRQIEADYGVAKDDANLLNTGPTEVERYRHMVGQEKQQPWGSQWYTWDNPDQSAIDEWTGEQNRLNTGMTDLRKDSTRMRELTQDPNGQYRPARALPWHQATPVAPGNAVTPQQPAAAGPTASAPGVDIESKIRDAYTAIKAGANYNAVRQRMIQRYGVDLDVYAP